ncbi:hypothetical protein ACF3MZ_10775 [Paenibacillaceae bacterium WGS1546]|uniref:hypothetical protein n=1 Tax=Cohnella sp. WGS1546 TaxID=3366810 RepID=UPI00372D694A
MTTDEDGIRHYIFEDIKASFGPNEMFAEGQSGYSESYIMMEDDKSYSAFQFHKDDQGLITGSLYKLVK